MKVKFIGINGTWMDVKNACRSTIGKDDTALVPTSSWKRRLLICEHSPIRKLHFSWKWLSLPYWVSVHFCRHHVGCSHYVSTQRVDRTNIDRNSKTQDAEVIHEIEANAQALINISRKRLCNSASLETRQAWIAVKEEIATIEPELASCMVRECIYRGFCPEFNSCGYYKTETFKKELEEYRQDINS